MSKRSGLLGKIPKKIFHFIIILLTVILLVIFSSGSKSEEQTLERYFATLPDFDTNIRDEILGKIKNKKIYKDFDDALKDADRAEVLILDNKNIDTLTGKIKPLTNLKMLVIRSNGKTVKLTSDLGDMKNLLMLGFIFTKVEQIPPEIGKLDKLMVLGFLDSNLSQIPKEFDKLTGLKVLLLKKNNLKSIPDVVYRLSHLEFLYLDHNIALQEINRIRINLPNTKVIY